VMSLVTWYLMVTKTITIVLERRKSVRFLETFWNAPSLVAVEKRIGANQRDEPFSHLAWHAINAARHHSGQQRSGAARLAEAGSGAEFLTRAMRRVIDEDTARLESGLTVLASVGSTAPFVGLLGTVWGVYHALVAIGLSGQGTLDKIAAPVGEALVMTAFGLAVAIPAVLAYNGFVRANRLVLARLDAFAHDVYALLTTGAHVSDPAHATPIQPVAAMKRA
jgi:biopolymer transport protein ExbB